MAPSLKHAFQSAKSDGTDNTLVQPSNWNSEHTLTLNTNNVLGRQTAGNGAVEEIPCTAQGRSILSAATLADLIAAGLPFFTTGDIKPTLKTAADAGWIMCNDGTLGNDTSGATLASTATALALYTLIWTNVPNTWAAIQDSAGTPTTRGGSAGADFTASKRLPITKMLGRALGAAGAGSGLTSRALGEIEGEETHLLSVGEMPSHTHTDSGHVHTPPGGGSFFVTGSGQSIVNVGSLSQTGATASAQANIQNTGGGGVHNNMQPTTFVNFMLKL